MDKSDFEFSLDRFNSLLTRNGRGLLTAKQRLLNTISHWPTFTQSMLSGNASISIDGETKKVKGDVLGKEFDLSFGVVATDDGCQIEAILQLASATSGEGIEIGRFYFTPEGEVLSSDRDAVLQNDEDHQSYHLLCAILRKVLASPHPA